MKHRPALPDERVNVSSEHPLKEAFWLTSAVLLIGLIVFIVSGVGVDFLASRLPADTGRPLQPQIAAALGKELGDPLEGPLAERTRVIFEQLLDEAGLTDEDVLLMIVDNPQANALAAPGEIIVVLAGLLREVKSDNELAMILGHELGHLKNRDHLRQMGRQLTLGALAALVLGNTSRLDQLLLLAPANAMHHRFSRKRERAADDEGFALVCRMYGHSGGAEDFFARHIGEDAALAFFASHPASRERVEHIVSERVRTGCAAGESVVFSDEK